MFATNYFDNTTYYNDTNFYAAGGVYDGYDTTGNVYNSSVCVKSSTLDYFCTIQNQEFYTADSVYSNDWNYGVNANAGTFGLGFNSPIWSMLGNPSTMMYDVYMANFNEWSTWAYPSYTAFTTASTINVGGFSSDYSVSTPHTSIKPSFQNTQLLPLTMFAFGKTYDNNTASYISILNDDAEFGIHQKTATLALNFRGLGLPTDQFEIFSNALATVTRGESTCLAFQGGYCALANTCDYYTDKGLWEYDFKLQFNTTSDNNYIRVPLATFAANHVENNGACVIFVEYLNKNLEDSQQIIVGGMFFQSIYAQYTLSGVSAVNIDLFVNTNAEQSSTYIGSQVVTEGVSAFAVKPMNV